MFASVMGSASNAHRSSDALLTDLDAALEFAYQKYRLQPITYVDSLPILVGVSHTWPVVHQPLPDELHLSVLQQSATG